MEGLFEANNYNGLAASKTWLTVNKHEQICDTLGKLRYVMFGTGAVSFYHLARFSSLSPSGRYCAGAGALFSLWGIFSVARERKHVRNQAGLDLPISQPKENE